MKVAEAALSACVVVLGAFISTQIRDIHRDELSSRPSTTVATAPGTVDSTLTLLTDAAPQHLVLPERPLMGSEPALEPVELLRRVDQGARGTYIDELLSTRDSALTRWPERVTAPLRVWIAQPTAQTGWSSDFPTSVREAFNEWVQTGIPMRFTFVHDSASADVHVRFISKFASGISGKTLWSRSASWWMESGDIVLSLSHPNGGSLTPIQMHAIALHEVGHLLGLDHTSDAGNIMSARVRVRELSEADRATIRLLYSVPAGSTRSVSDSSAH